MNASNPAIRKAIVAFACALYALSLFLPGLLFERRAPLPGYEILMFGWLGILSFDFAWYGNPMFVLSAIFLGFKHARKSAFTSSVGFFLGFLAVFAKEWWFNEGAGTPIKELGIGYYIWMCSFLLLMFGSFFMPEFSESQQNQNRDHA
ncbi:MAG: hypothetical protein KF853_15865 [Rhodocyclaceae bacterium]|nr:hypothetical protein [Rhodocyclaceae bacterium]